MFWYALFVKTSYEQMVANEISARWYLEDSKPFVPMYDAIFKHGGKVYPERRRLCSRYVFIAVLVFVDTLRDKNRRH